MPRLKKKEPDFIRVTRLIRGYAPVSKVAEMIGRSVPTARKKINDPRQFTLGELQMISMRAHIPWEAMNQAVKP